MSIVFQLAGRMRPGAAEPLAQAFGQVRDAARVQPGFLRVRLLVNRATLQFQILLHWSNYEQGLAFHREVYPRVSRAIAPLVESQGTAVTSRVELALGTAAAPERAV